MPAGCYNQPISYASGWNGSYITAAGGTQALSSGIFLSAVPSGLDISSGLHGVIGVYRCTKDFKTLDDAAAVVFIGRKKPVAEFGIFEFESGQIAFSIPPPGYLYSTGVDYNPLDRTLWTNVSPNARSTVGDLSGTSAESALRKIVYCQHNVTAAGSTCLCAVQTNKGKVLYGTLYNLDVKDSAAGWTDVSMEFAEVGTATSGAAAGL